MRSGNTQMPNFFVIGAAKCGTSSLHEYLDLHPDISMSDIKEPRYFLQHRGPARNDTSHREDYLGLFEAGTAARGESSPQYSMFPQWAGVPRAIGLEVDNPKFIYLVRDPIERVRSMVTHLKAIPVKDGRLRRDASLTEAFGDISRPLESQILSTGLYMTQISQFLEEFPRECIFVIDSDDLKLSPAVVLLETFEFLGLAEASVVPEEGIVANRSENLREKTQLYLSLANSRILRRLVYRLPRKRRDALVERVRVPLSRSLPREQMEPRLRRQLEELYRPEVEKLREFTGKSFPSWSI